MAGQLKVQRVEVSFVDAAPARQVERASGVSEVEVHGRFLRCTVDGHEVISFRSIHQESE
jgi:hypothetical protein